MGFLRNRPQRHAVAKKQTGIVEIYEDAVGEIRFRVKGNNGEIIAPSSQGYRDVLDAQRGLAALRGALVSPSIRRTRGE